MVTICTTCHNITKLRSLPTHCIMSFTLLTKKKHVHWMVEFHTANELRSLWHISYIFMYNLQDMKSSQATPLFRKPPASHSGGRGSSPGSVNNEALTHISPITSVFSCHYHSTNATYWSTTSQLPLKRAKPVDLPTKVTQLQKSWHIEKEKSFRYGCIQRV